VSVIVYWQLEPSLSSSLSSLSL